MLNFVKRCRNVEGKSTIWATFHQVWQTMTNVANIFIEKNTKFATFLRLGQCKSWNPSEIQCGEKLVTTHTAKTCEHPKRVSRNSQKQMMNYLVIQREGTAVTRPRESILMATRMQGNPWESPKVASSRLSLQVHCCWGRKQLVSRGSSSAAPPEEAATPAQCARRKELHLRKKMKNGATQCREHGEGSIPTYRAG